MQEIKINTLRLPVEELLQGLLTIGEPNAQLAEQIHPVLLQSLLQIRAQQFRSCGHKRTWLMLDSTGQEMNRLQQALKTQPELANDLLDVSTDKPEGWAGKLLYLGPTATNHYLTHDWAWIQEVSKQMQSEDHTLIGLVFCTTLWIDELPEKQQPFRVLKDILGRFGVPGIVCYGTHTHVVDLAETKGEFPTYDLFKTKLIFRCQHTDTSKMVHEWGKQADNHNNLPSFITYSLDIVEPNAGAEFVAIRLLHVGEAHKDISRHHCLPVSQME